MTEAHARVQTRHVDYEHEQLSLLLGANFVVTFQEHHTDVLNSVRQRLRKDESIRSRGVDFLFYTIVDLVVDGYFPVLERYGDELNDLESEVIFRPTAELLTRVNNIKRELMFLRRAIWPQRDALNVLVRGEAPVVSEGVRTYLRDSYDHTVQLGDLVESYREVTNNLLNTYLSALSQRTNEIMKVLTIVGAIFIPLTFLAGVYGMNFHNMPELSMQWSYPALWCVFFIIAGGMMWWFKREGWIFGGDSLTDLQRLTEAQRAAGDFSVNSHAHSASQAHSYVREPPALLV